MCSLLFVFNMINLYYTKPIFILKSSQSSLMPVKRLRGICLRDYLTIWFCFEDVEISLKRSGDFPKVTCIEDEIF